MVSALEAQSVVKEYVTAGTSVRAVDEVSFSLQPGDFVALVGPSGSGKTTLLAMLAGLLAPTSGSIVIGGEELSAMSEAERARFRRRSIGFTFQANNLVPYLTALENVMFPAELKRDVRARAKADALLGRVGLGDRKANFPHQLSGGEKQRVAICRALINDPTLLYADEPTGNLDSKNGEAILDLLTALHAERRMTMLMVTHSAAIAERSGRVLTLHDGRLVADTSRNE